MEEKIYEWEDFEEILLLFDEFLIEDIWDFKEHYQNKKSHLKNFKDFIKFIERRKNEKNRV